MGKSNSYYMEKAISIAHSCLCDNKRYPFGSIIVKDNSIIGIGKEGTRVNNDPTSHSEIEAIRDACRNLKTSDLSTCVLYTSSEPCSMCLAALFWAQVDTVYYACSREDVFDFGFSDRFKLIEKRVNSIDSNLNQIDLHQLKNDKGIQVFKEWELREDIIQK